MDGVELLRRRRRGVPVGDRLALVFAVGLLVVQALGNNEGATGVEPRGFDAGAAVILAGATALVFTARRAPSVSSLGALALTVVWYQVGYTSGLINVPYLLAFYQLGVTGDRRRQLLVGGVTVAGMLVAMLAAGDESVTSVAAALGWTVAAMLFGEVTHNRQALMAAYEAGPCGPRRSATPRRSAGWPRPGWRSPATSTTCWPTPCR